MASTALCPRSLTKKLQGNNKNQSISLLQSNACKRLFSSLTLLSPCNFRSMQWMLILHVHYYYYFGAPAGWCDWIKLFYHDAWILITWLKKIGYMDRQPYKLTWEHGKSGWAKTPVELGNERILFKFWIYICIFSRIWYMLFE